MSTQRQNIPDDPNIQVIKAGKTGLFSNYIFKAIPLAFDESLSYYECLCGLLNYLKEVIIKTLNNNAEAVAELQRLYEELKSYVDNYFTNLDVQEEINNKLDAMVEDGSLQEIIDAYLSLKTLLVFDNVDDMKAGVNLVEGSYVKTLGYYSLNDGGGALYKIRTITNEDVVNNMTIIPLEKPNLIAVLCIEDNVKLKQLGAKNDEDVSDILQFAIDLTKERYTLIVDDYYLLEDSVNIDKPVIIKGDVSTYSNNGSCGFNCNKNENITYFNFNEGSANCVIDHLVFKNNRLGTCIKFSSRDESLTDYRVWKNNFNKCRFQNFNVAINFYAIGDVTEYDYSSEMLFTDCKFYNNAVSCEYNNVQSYNTNFISTDFECSPTNSGKGFVLNAYGGINIIGGSIILHDSFIKLSQNEHLDPPNKYIGIINVSNCRFETFHETVFDYTLESRKTYYSTNNLNINNTEIYTHNNDAVLIDNNIRELKALCNVTFSGGQPIYINGQNEQAASEFSRIIVNTPQPEKVIVNYVGGQFTPWIIVNDTVLSSCVYVNNSNNHFNYKGKILLGFNKANKPADFTITVPWYIRKFVMNVNGGFIANTGTITIHNSDSTFTYTFTKSVAGNTTVNDEVYLPYSDSDQEFTIESDNIWGNCYFE